MVKRRLAIIGAGWAGLAAAIAAVKAGHEVTLLEASRAPGGRARALASVLPDGQPVTLDNGQHILIGAYRDTLALMREVGVDPDAVLHAQTMTLRFPDGCGLQFPEWPTPLDALGGILGARGWSVGDKLSLLWAAAGWRLQNFTCEAGLSVSALCRQLPPGVMAGLIEPLCVSALNTPAARASAQVFLRVMQDALFSVPGGSRLLLPRADLSALFPAKAQIWLQLRGARLRLGERVQALQKTPSAWRVASQEVDAVILATDASNACRILDASMNLATELVANELQAWSHQTAALQFEAIATVYAWAPGARLSQPMLSLRSQEGMGSAAPAQFVFDRGQLGGPAGLLAFVVSASADSREAIQAAVLGQARQQLGLALQAVQTVVEKRATFACTPGLERPPQTLADGLVACGDYVAGPYPATLEGAVRSGQQAVAALLQQ